MTLVGLFLAFMVGQTLTGLRVHNDEQRQHGDPALTLGQYLRSGAFLEATAENWESEFLQMTAYVVFTVFLFQKGSAESKKLEGKEAVDRDPRLAKGKATAPGPVRRGGWQLSIYEYSLSLAFLTLFAISFVLHAWGGLRLFNETRQAHGEGPLTLSQYVLGAQFWFESFQNWQSEFLSLAAMVILGIFLRHRGSPESKPVDAPHSQTGSE